MLSRELSHAPWGAHQIIFVEQRALPGHTPNNFCWAESCPLCPGAHQRFFVQLRATPCTAQHTLKNFCWAKSHPKHLLNSHAHQRILSSNKPTPCTVQCKKPSHAPCAAWCIPKNLHTPNNFCWAKSHPLHMQCKATLGAPPKNCVKQRAILCLVHAKPPL